MSDLSYLITPEASDKTYHILQDILQLPHTAGMILPDTLDSLQEPLSFHCPLDRLASPS